MPVNRTPNSICEQCGTAFYVKPARLKQSRYCQRSCKDAALVKPRCIIQSDLDRFWAKVDKSAGPDGCWPWTGSHDPKRGYGRFSIRTESGIGTIGAPRFSMVLAGYDIDGLEACHDCPGGDNPTCVNPSHLFLGTHRENMIDMVQKGCASKGHGLVGEEMYQSILTKAQVMEARQRYVDTDLPLWRMAKEYGITRKGLILAINGTNWSHLPRPVPTVGLEEAQRIRDIRAFNQRPIRSKLTENQVREIRQSFNCGGVTVAHLARQYGLSHTAMDRVVRGLVWKDIAWHHNSPWRGVIIGSVVPQTSAYTSRISKSSGPDLTPAINLSVTAPASVPDRETANGDQKERLVA